MGEMTIALIGNPNCGKTTLFNALTESREYVGNWAGVTVEKKIGTFKTNENLFKVVDLPGIYSLNTFSIEEIVSKNFIIDEKPDAIVNIIDASNLERNLYLTLQVLELNRPTIIALNMMDAVERDGDKIDALALSKALNVPVVPISAAKNQNINGLINGLVALISSDNRMEISSSVDSQGVGQFDNTDALTEKRYSLINEIVSKVLIKAPLKRESFTDRLDHILTHRILAIPIFLCLMLIVFKATFTWIGQPLSDLLDSFISGPFTDAVTSILQKLSISSWLKSLIVDGIIGGVGGIVIFFPLIFILFLFISILEDSGYMARVAFMMDRVMRKIGLSGKAVIPLVLGFGCSVPAIMAARTMENEKDKKLLALIVPFMSCNARLPVYALFAVAFFKGHESLVILSLYAIGFIIAILFGLLFKNTLFKGQDLPFIMELPRYKVPSLKGILLNAWDKSKGFLQKAGTIIFAMSVLIWFLSNYNFSGHTNINHSFLSYIGKFMAPIFSLSGFGDWKAAVSLLTGFMAKEVVVGTMSVIYGSDTTAKMSVALARDFTSLSAYAFMVFVLLYTPCVTAIATIKKELNSWKWTSFSIFYQFAVALVMSIAIFQIGSLLGL